MNHNFGISGLDNYVATKHAVVGWTRSLSYLHNACNVRVNAICPYWVGKYPF